MKRNHETRRRLEEATAEAYRRQPVLKPSGTWYQTVMQRVHREAVVPRVVHLHVDAQVAWRAACIAGAVAVIVAAVTMNLVPSRAQLVWQLQQDGTVSGWALRVER